MWLCNIHNFIAVYSYRKQEVETWMSMLHFEVDPIVVLHVWVINIPVPPFPKGGCHFIQKPALCFVTEYMLPQALSSGSVLLPQFLLVSSLFAPENKKSAWKHSCFKGVKDSKTVKGLYLTSDPKATMQPHEPICHSFYSLPLPLLHTVVR